MPVAKKYPIIVIWDMDKTMIGDTNLMMKSVNLVKFVRQAIQSKKIEDAPSPKNMTYHDFIVPGFIRPGLSDLFSGIKKTFPTAEFFVYSSGDKKYVESIVPVVEKETGVTFRRPLFSRPDCVYDGQWYRKSIQAQMDIIVSALLPDYPILKDAEAREAILKGHVIFLDDTDVVWDMPTKWVQCSSYDFYPVIDVSSFLDLSIRQHPIVKEYIAKENAFFEEPTDPSITTYERNLMYHTYMANYYASYLEQSKRALEDTFCKRLLKALKPYKNRKHPFTDKNVEKIRKEVMVE
jgi:hypothetical protein